MPSLLLVTLYGVMILRRILRRLEGSDEIRAILTRPAPDTDKQLPGRRLKVVTGWAALVGGAAWLGRKILTNSQEAAAITGGAAVAAGITAVVVFMPPPRGQDLPTDAVPAPTAPRLTTEEPEPPAGSWLPPASGTTTGTPDLTARPIIHIPPVTTPPPLVPTLAPPVSTTVHVPIPPVETSPEGPASVRTQSVCIHLTGLSAQRWLCLGSNRLPG